MKTLLTVILLSAAPMFAAEPTTTAARAINALGIDLLHQTGNPGANALLSPYSIQSALAMTYAGADGDTRAEMAKVLHYPKDDAEVHRSFAALRKALDDVMQKSVRDAERMQQQGGKIDPITLTTANRLFGQTGYAFREPFLKLVKDNYDAPFEPLDFARNPSSATKHINAWVEDHVIGRPQTMRHVCVGGFHSQADAEHNSFGIWRHRRVCESFRNVRCLPRNSRLHPSASCENCPDIS